MIIANALPDIPKGWLELVTQLVTLVGAITALVIALRSDKRSKTTDKNVNRVAQGTDAVIRAQNSTPGTPNVHPAIAKRVSDVAANSDTAIVPAITDDSE